MGTVKELDGGRGKKTNSFQKSIIKLKMLKKKRIDLK